MTLKALMTEEAWKAERMKHITSTDAAKLLGLSKFGDPFSVWLDKTGQAEPKEASRRMRAGLHYQTAIVDDYAETTRHKVQHVDPHALYIGGSGILAASLDALDVDLNYCPVDAKNVYAAHKDEGWGEDGTDQIPPDYRCQLAVQMAVTGATLARLAVLVGGWDLRIYQMDRDTKLEAMILEAAERFWRDHVVANKAPELPPTKEASDYLTKKYPLHEAGKVVESTPDDLPWREYFKQAQADKEDAERRETEAKNWFKARLGTAEAMYFPDGKKATWKTSKTSEKVDYEAAFNAAALDPQSRQFLLKKFTEAKPGIRRFTLN